MSAKKTKKFPIGGVNLPERKNLTRNKSIEKMSEPDEVAIPIAQHIGAPAKPIVKKGDKVKKGDLIAKFDEGLSARIHASIGGIVQGTVKRPMPERGEMECILIKKDDKKQNLNNFEIAKNEDITPEIIRERVEKAGVVGLGGACFPTHVKLNPPEEKEIDTVIINGAECEPFLTVDHRLLLEEYTALFRGLQLIKNAVGAQKGIIAIEVNKQDAIDKLQEKITDWPDLEVTPLDTRYPHGAEKHLIKAVLDREVPLGELPMEVGVVVNNVQTAIKIARAVDEGSPLISRVITVSGDALKKPTNLEVPIGTSIKDVIEYCGGASTDKFQVVVGGPMTGINADNTSTPITKGTSGVVLIPADEYSDSEKRACIRCGKCVDVCPMYLSPNRICDFVNNDLIDQAVNIGLMDCIECGACAYVCPSKRPLVRWIKRGKARADN
ncbi:MAG: electron transport complex subunit RsxC [Bacillota bacterium]